MTLEQKQSVLARKQEWLDAIDTLILHYTEHWIRGEKNLISCCGKCDRRDCPFCIFARHDCDDCFWLILEGVDCGAEVYKLHNKLKRLRRLRRWRKIVEGLK